MALVEGGSRIDARSTRLREMTRWGVGSRLTASAIVLTLLLAAPAAFICWRNYTSTRNHELAQTSNLAVATATNAETLITASLKAVSTVARAPAVRSGDVATMQKYFDLLRTELGPTAGMVWVDRGGMLRASSGAAPGSLPRDIGTSEYARAALAATEPTVLPALPGGATSTSPVIVVVVPTIDDQSQPSGVLAGGFFLDQVEALATRLTSRDARLYVIDGSGQLIVAGGPVAELRNVGDSPLLSALDRSDGSLGNTTGLLGDEGRMVAARTVPSGNWRIIIERSESDALGHARVALAIEFVAIGCAGLIAIAAAWLAGRRVDRQRTQDRVVAERIATLNVELERRLADLQEALGAKDEFLGSVSHELRTPLTSLGGLVKVLRDRRDTLSRQQQDEVVEQLAADAERLQRIIESTLTLARLGGSQGATEPVLLQRLVPAVVDGHQSMHPRRRLDTLIDDGLPPVMGERTWIDQVLSNLLTNAEKYTPASTAITVHVQRAGARVEVAVLDQGPGISPSEALLVFEPFRRLERDRYRAPGSGLGLAVAKRLVELMGGGISASSRPEGGAIFVFWLPVCIDAFEAVEDAPPRELSTAASTT